MLGIIEPEEIASLAYRFSDHLGAIEELEGNYYSNDREYINRFLYTITHKHSGDIKRILKFVPITPAERKAFESFLRPGWYSIRGTTNEARQRNAWQRVYNIGSLLLPLSKRYEKDYEDIKESFSETSLETKVGNFLVHNNSGFPPEVIDRISFALRLASKEISSSGFGYVLYGDVYIEGNVGSGWAAAWYNIDNDYVVFRADIAKVDDKVIHDIAHELGHRLWFRFPERIRKDYYKRLYNYKKRSIEPPKPLPGQEYVFDEDHKLIVRDTFTYLNKKTHNMSKGVSLYVVQGAEEFPTEMSVRKFNKYFRLWSAKYKGVFVSSYASRDEQEDFAEMFAFMVMDQLSNEHTDQFIEGLA